MSAPVTLITGLPGNGKTLWTICAVKEKSEKEKRPVYYAGIEIVDKQALPWTEIDPKEWFKCPPGSLIVLDEAHKVFPLRANGSAVPDHVLPIAELRHDGQDLFLLTQDGMELDASIRRRVGAHFYCVRRMGWEACALFEWPRFRSDFASKAAKKDARQHEWIYNKKAYHWYVSAEVHTVKKQFPLRLLWILAIFIFVPLAVWGVWHFYDSQRSGSLMASSAPVASASAPAGASQGQGGRTMTPAEYVRQFDARVPGLAYTAPVYDGVTKPVRAPYPAACVRSKTRCQCYSQQGTRLEVPKPLCEGISAGGFFMAWDEQQKVQPVQPVRSPVTAPTAEPLPGLINATPGYTPSNSRPLADQVADGQALRHGKNNRIPGQPG